MKSLFTLVVFSFFALSVSAQKSDSKTNIPDPAKKIETVDASCGECQFKMAGKGCHLAVRIDGKGYFVDGTSLDDHGDAHASDGFCEAIRKAEVQGDIVDNRFKVTYFKLVTPEPKKKSKPNKGK